MIRSEAGLRRRQVDVVTLFTIVSEVLFLAAFGPNRVERLVSQKPWQYQQTVFVECFPARRTKLVVVQR